MLPFHLCPSIDRLTKKFAEFVTRSLGEILTPERLQEMKATLEQTAQDWKRKGNPYGGMLELEVSDLEGEPLENRFLYAAFVGQLNRWRVLAQE